MMKENKKLGVVGLVGIGIGGIIGAGFFLGSSLAVGQAGPSVIIAFILGGLIMSQVLGAMTSISMNRPVPGSFRVYVEQFLGRYPGFLLGWIMYLTGILTISSEALAAGIFLRFWLPHIPLPVLSASVLLLVAGSNLLSARFFSLAESAMAFLKIVVLLVFIAVGAVFLLRQDSAAVSWAPGSFFPNGFTGLLQSMLIVIFTYAGISSIAMASPFARDPGKDIKRAVVFTTAGTTLLYVVSIFLIVSLVRWDQVNTGISPFVQAFGVMGMGWGSDVINLVILVATVSVMAATYYSGIQIMSSLARSRDAPSVFMRGKNNGFPWGVWLSSGIACLLVIGVSFLIGSKLFNYLVSCSSYITFLNWILNLVTYLRWRRHRSSEETLESRLVFGKPGAFAAIVLIVLLFAFSLTVTDFRTGFYVFGAIIVLVSAAYLLLARKRNRQVAK